MRTGAGVKVGAPVNPRMTKHTKPLSPARATSYPVLVKTFIVAWSEMLAGAALLANAISASRCIMYALRGGYFISCADKRRDARASASPIDRAKNNDVLILNFSLRIR